MNYNRQDAIYCLQMAKQWAGSFEQVPYNTEAIAWFNTYLRIASELNGSLYLNLLPKQPDSENLKWYNNIVRQIKAIEELKTA